MNATLPEIIVQTCLFHLLSNAMSFASGNDGKPLAQALPTYVRADDLVWHQTRSLGSDPLCGAMHRHDGIRIDHREFWHGAPGVVFGPRPDQMKL